MEPLVFTGKYTSCKVFTENIEASAIARVYSFLNCPAFEGVQIRIMPDVHEGKGAVIGFTCPLNPLESLKIVPNVIGVDIGCGVQAVPLSVEMITPSDFSDFDKWLRACVPSGFAHRTSPYPDLRKIFIEMIGNASWWDDFEKDVTKISLKIGQTPEQVWNQCGTLGGGNHFIEIARDLEGNLWLVVHSGSRNFGLRIAEFHQRKAQDFHGGNRKNELAWLEGEEAQGYLRDMRVAQKFAMLNRLIMLDSLLQFEETHIWELKDSLITSVHNFIGDDGIIRKGAISAKAGEKVIIPWNMAEGSIVGIGKGNPDWNFSAPHGAGRAMSRGDAKRGISMHAYEQRMTASGVWSSCIDENTLDECPQAYKSSSEVEACIGDTVEVTNRLKPVYNFKASEDPDKKRLKQERKFKRIRDAKFAAENKGIDGQWDKDPDEEV
ncbi:MAG: RtcB family protein [Bacteroidota bacterium]|jgi:RNA-splicing ligase RtcB